MASAVRRSEPQALVFVPQYIQSKPKGSGVTLSFTPKFMWKNQRPNQVNDPWYIPVVRTGKPDFGPPTCPVRALRYYHRYRTEHSELRRQTPLVYSIQEQSTGKELSAASISH